MVEWPEIPKCDIESEDAPDRFQNNPVSYLHSAQQCYGFYKVIISCFIATSYLKNYDHRNRESRRAHCVKSIILHRLCSIAISNRAAQ